MVILMSQHILKASSAHDDLERAKFREKLTMKSHQKDTLL